MKKLTNKEEEIMQVLWKLEKAFVKEIMEEIPEPKPHYNTLSTTVRKMETKGFVGHEAFGNTHRYFPKITKEEYRNTFIDSTIKNYFDNSVKKMLSFFAKEEKISSDELEEIIALIDKEKDKK
ncbi:BlaI/MecI/CopY family transcriptional regulator [Aureivirga marina]|uniref:BlaI/MecI/CopY family transcriptional regulator n=1 Tax=Aureivirga marina TaxID=1182451 RepID=UPI0018CA324A|nr:BlaI/MecI/CopY family transcriptional regulator [Aureivirga marina]